MSLYGLCLLLGALLSWRTLRIGTRHWGLRKGTRATLFLLTAALGYALSRVHYILLSPYGRMGLGFVSAQPYEYALCGAVLGGVIAGWLTAKITRQSVGFVLDALAPTGLLTIAIARAAEVFADFGWGSVVEGRFARFPFAVADMYDQWHWSVFFLESALALLVLAGVMLRKQNRTAPGEVFALSLLWWAMGQAYCEVLRAESIRRGFVCMQQLECVLFALGILLVYGKKRGFDKKQLGIRAGVWAACVGLIAFAEYAMDKLTHRIPVPGSYALMAGALLTMGVMIQLTILRKKKA